MSILHEGLLRPLLDITDEKLDAKTHVEYTADQAEAVELARAARYQAAFLIAPTTPAELQAVVRGGELCRRSRRTSIRSSSTASCSTGSKNTVRRMR